MNYLTWVVFNGSLFTLNLIPNAFYLFCMVCPLQGEMIKQPLKLLLSSLILSTIAYLALIFSAFFSDELAESNTITRATSVLSVWCLSMSISSSVWLNFFYCTQIVPAHRAIFIWIKKNIKPIIFCIWLVGIIPSMFDFFLVLIKVIPLDDPRLNDSSPVYHMNQMPVKEFTKHVKDMYLILIILQRSHYFLCLGVMVLSTGATVVYLCKHMRHIVAHGQSLSCPRLSSQLRVTTTGILQGVLYVLFAVWREYSFVSQHTDAESISKYVHFTVINLYMSGTTFNVGVSQAVFRHRAADIWKRARQCCDAHTELPPQ